MLLRGHAPQSEPFRKWVTEEVLPSIRKTGSYNVNESETPEAVQFSGEFSQLHAALAELTGDVCAYRAQLPRHESAVAKPFQRGQYAIIQFLGAGEALPWKRPIWTSVVYGGSAACPLYTGGRIRRSL